MSGPKCETYHVAAGRNERLLRARLAAASLAARNAEARVKAALADVRAAESQLGTGTVASGTPPVMRTGGSAESLEAYVTQADAFVRDARTAVGKARSLAHLRTLIAQTSHDAVPVRDWSDELRERGAAGRAQQQDAGAAERERAASTVQRIVARLQAVPTEPEQHDIDALSAAIAGCTDSVRADGLVSELRLRVQRANDRDERARRDAAIAAALAAQLRGLEGDDVAAARADVQAVQDGRAPLRADLAARVETVRIRAEKRADDAYVNDVLREELTRLGYVVGPEFATIVASGGEAVVRRPEQPDYAVEIGVDSERGTMDLSVVRLDDAKSDGADRAYRDKQAEERWCRDHDALRAALQQRGVHGRMIRHLPAGAQPVRIVRATGAVGSRRSRRDDALQREL